MSCCCRFCVCVIYTSRSVCAKCVTSNIIVWFNRQPSLAINTYQCEMFVLRKLKLPNSLHARPHQRTHAYESTHTRMHAPSRTHTHARALTHAHAHAHARTRARARARAHAHAHAHTRTRTRTRTHTHTHTHTHTVCARRVEIMRVRDLIDTRYTSIYWQRCERLDWHCTEYNACILFLNKINL